MGVPIIWAAWAQAGPHQSTLWSVVRLWMRVVVGVIDPAAFLLRSRVVPPTILAASVVLVGVAVVAVVTTGSRASLTARSRRRQRPTKGERAPEETGP